MDKADALNIFLGGIFSFDQIFDKFFGRIFHSKTRSEKHRRCPFKILGEDFRGGRAVMAWPSHFLEQIQSAAPLTRTVWLVARGKETVTIPAGEFQAWHFELQVQGSKERQQVWYDVEAPHTLVKYYNGMETFSLMEQDR